MNTKAIGKRSEALISLKFLMLGWVVLTPLGDNERYDLVIDRGNGFERVQCKTGSFRDGVIIFDTMTTMPKAKGGYRKNRYTADEIELFAVYCEHTKGVYLVPISDVKSNGRLRVDPTKNRQSQNVRWARNYEIP